MAWSWSVLPRPSGSQKNMVYLASTKILPFSWLLVDFGIQASNRALSMNSKLSCKIRLMFTILFNVGGVSNTAMTYSCVKGVMYRVFVQKITSGWPGNAPCGILQSRKKICPLLDLCWSLGEHSSIHGDNDAGTVELSQAYDVALQTFLSITILAEYEQHYDCRLDIELDASTRF